MFSICQGHDADTATNDGDISEQNKMIIQLSLNIYMYV